MSTIERTNKAPNERESATTISANARLDYILRFSKHAVLVIDDDAGRYMNVGNEFLGSLSKDHNAAFVSISSKLNDIQIRCRIIEQLFGNTLFDPEQPLSVNVVKLAEAKNEAITIVISNVEFLSLQLSHELCQLAEVAKKLNKTINVILLGKVESAKKLSENKHLFNNKLSILLAENGQLISWNSSLLKVNKANILVRNLMIFSIIIMIILAALFSIGYFNGNAISNEESINEQVMMSENDYKKEFVQTSTDINTTELLINKSAENTTIATTAEIFESLTIEHHIEEPLDNTVISESVIENEIVSGNTKNMDSAKENDIIVDEERENLSLQKSLAEQAQVKVENTDNYYQNFTGGYVIQLGNFERSDGYKSFLNTHKNQSFYGYTKVHNGVISYIVTSQVYANTSQAKIAIKDLSKDLRSRGPWIKSVKAVNNEINLYKQSQ